MEVNTILDNIDLVNKEKLFQMATYRSTRGHPFKLFKRRARINVRANSFSLRVIDNWNMLPASVVTAPSIKSFKSRLNKHGLRHPSKFTGCCYTPGQQIRYRTQLRNAPEQAIE